MKDNKNIEATIGDATPPKGKHVAKAAAIAGLSCALALGGTLAFFTATDTLENTFGVIGSGESGKQALAIDVDTPSWDSSDANHYLIPGVEFSHDPVVTNTEGVDAWCMLKVTAPAKDGAASVDDALFDFGTMGAGWKQLKAPELVDGKWVGYYGYQSKVAEGAKTTALFTSATYDADLIAEDVAKLPATVTIAVDAMAIQAQGFNDVDAAFAATSWGA